MTGERLDGTLFGPGQPCFGCGPDHPIGFHLSFEREGDEVVTRFTPHERYQGPPGIMHGGLVATLIDEIAAWAIVAEMGRFGFTGSMSIKLSRPVRIGVELQGRGRITRKSSRVVDTHAVITQHDAVCAEGELRFALFDKAGAERLLGSEMPEAWRRFAR